MAALIDLTGQTFQRLTIIRRAPNDKFKNTRWIVRCACGSPERNVPGDSLLAGHSRSCGCLKLEGLSKLRRTHGASRTREYAIWCGMKKRCENPKTAQFGDYGGRGIKVAPEFQTFEGFLAYLGPCPSGLTLDRIETNGNYEPGNVRWASRLTQGRNTRRVHLLTLDGKTQTLSAWAAERDITAESIRTRLDSGWTCAEALTAPKGARLRRLRFPNQATDAEKLKARVLMKSAIASGRLIRRPCEVCGNPRSEGHHTNYRRPVSGIRWFCRTHHTAIHRDFRRAYSQ